MIERRHALTALKIRLPILFLETTVREHIENTVGRTPPESGGILGGQEGRVTRFFFDKNAQTTRLSYRPSLRTLNPELKRWSAEGVMFMGVLHSHPMGDHLSPGDICYARKILTKNPGLRYVDMLLLSPDTHGKLKGRRVTRRGERKLSIRYR